MTNTSGRADVGRFVEAIRRSGLSIYDGIAVGDPKLWIPAPELEVLLDRGLRGLHLKDLPLRTRSKVVKATVCEVLGYPVPASFRKTQPRFPGQCFDTYVQKSNNLQVWNEELASVRRYVLIRLSQADMVTKVKVVTGDTLSLLDTTGTLTQKYQATCTLRNERTELVSARDTERVLRFVSDSADLRRIVPTSHPQAGELLSIGTLFNRVSGLIGRTFMDTGQEGSRGAALHELVCKELGYSVYQDDGQFPDIRHQLLEVKLQTSQTIDLGLVRPNSTEPLDVPMIRGVQMRHCDARYAIFYARLQARRVTITHAFLTTGKDFFERFPQFQGKVLNKKLQIPLPSGFFDR